jgi:hypothetical protein
VNLSQFKQTGSKDLELKGSAFDLWRKSLVDVFVVRGEDIDYYKTKTRAHVKKWIEQRGERDEWLVWFVPFGRLQARSELAVKAYKEVYEQLRSDMPASRRDRLLRVELQDGISAAAAWEVCAGARSRERQLADATVGRS